MAIYRPPKPRWPLALAVGVLSLLVGIGVGLLAGGGEVDLEEANRELRARLIEAGGSLEVATVEYEESVSNGEVVNPTEYDGAVGAFESSKNAYQDVSGALEVIAPDLAGEIDAGFEECEALVTERVESERVAECLDGLRGLLVNGR